MQMPRFCNNYLYNSVLTYTDLYPEAFATAENPGNLAKLGVILWKVIGKFPQTMSIKLIRFRSQIEALAIPAPKDKAATERWHADEPGFGVRVMRATRRGEVRRSWIARYSVTIDGKRQDRKPVIENVPVDASRKHFLEAKRIAAEIRTRARRHDRVDSAPTLARAWQAYIQLREDELAEATVVSYQKCFTQLKAWHERPLDEISVGHWEKKYLEISTTSGRATARTVLRFAHLLYARAVERHQLRINPVAIFARDVRLYAKGEPRQRFISKEKLPQFWLAVHQLHPSVRDYIIWILFTGFRKSLAGALAWERVDTATKSYLIEVKDRGNKAKRRFNFPIPETLWERVVVPRMALRRDSDLWLIPSPKRAGSPTRAPRGSYDSIQVKTGLRVSAHDIRRTFGTIAHATLKDIVIVGRLMTHSVRISASDAQARLTGDYVISGPDDLRDGINRVAEAILALAKAKGT